MALHLVVGNQTLGSRELRAVLQARAALPDARLHVVVPQTPMDHYRVPHDGHVQTIAEHQLELALADFASLGVPVTGEVGDEHPFEAVRVVVDREHPDEVIVSTFALGASRWLGAGLPSRIERKLAVAVCHVVGQTYDLLETERRRYAEVRAQLDTT